MARTVLIAFDQNEPSLVPLQRRALENAGWNVCECSDGLAALRRADTMKVDAVVTTDFLQPISGVSLGGLLKVHPETEHIRVVLLSAAPERVREEARRSHIDRVLAIESLGTGVVRTLEAMFSPVAPVAA